MNTALILDDLKTLIFGNSGIPCCQQILSGWPNNYFPSNKETLSKLSLPDRYLLTLTISNEDGNQERNGRYNISKLYIY